MHLVMIGHFIMKKLAEELRDKNKRNIARLRDKNKRNI